MKNIYQNREVSVLSFNERVLQEAEDTRNPLMERLRFLGIFSSNMDEFFKVRVAGIHRRIELGKKSLQKVLDFVTQEAQELDERFQAAYADVTSALAREGITILNEADIDEQPADVATWLHSFFRERVLPTLVPIIIHKSQPFPQLTDGALYFGVVMWGEKLQYAILEIPASLPRFVELPSGNIMYVDDVIRYSLNDVFYIFDYFRIEAFEFKISRDAELDIDNDFSEGHVRKMERVLKQRRGGRPTRLVFDADMPQGLRKLLRRGLQLSEGDTLIGGGRYHNMRDLMGFPSRRPDLCFERTEPARHPVLDRTRVPMMDIIREQDLLVTYPYQSFDHIVRLLREAAIDPAVREIKMTLYRVAKESQVVNALINAAQNGKEIFASIELQARFDEERNIQMAERLRDAGAVVAFGVPPMKVHSKLLLIRKGNQKIVGFSTGNFNETTARLYVDSMLLTADKRLGNEVDKVFAYLDEASRMRTVSTPRYKQLLVSPFNMRRSVLRLLAREKAKGEEGYVFLKVNHLTDAKVTRALIDAAEAGVRMDLVVRTTYAVPPHPHVRAISILDRYLEHQRVYIFGQGEDRQVFMSSADLMERNLDNRVEASFPIYDPTLQQEVVDMMVLQVADTYKARELDPEQSNHYVLEGTDFQRAQDETQRYLRELYNRSDPRPVSIAES